MKVGNDGVLYSPLNRVDNMTVNIWIQLDNSDKVNFNLSTSEGYQLKSAFNISHILHCLAMKVLIKDDQIELRFDKKDS